MVISRYFLLSLAVIAIGLNPGNAPAEVGSDTKPAPTTASDQPGQSDQRVQDVGFRLVSANAPFCSETISRGGLTIAEHGLGWIVSPDLGRDRPIVPMTEQEAKTHLPLVGTVAMNGPADEAGLLAGDRISAINGQLTPALSYIEILSDGQHRLKNPVNVVSGYLDQQFSSGVTRLLIFRDGKDMELSISPTKTCRSWFQTVHGKKRIASADGNWVTIGSPLIDFMQSDDELAAVIAHELAHNLLKHKERLNAQKVNRGFFGQFGKSAGRIKQAEIEADRLSVWLMKNAGFEPQAAIRFWTRYGKQHGKGIFSASTHYRWKKRVKLFEEEIAKIETAEIVDGKVSPPLLAIPAQ
ncbi:MAG: hypothetical protein Pars2KO_06770 [Parasphingorhabdus sp.]